MAPVTCICEATFQRIAISSIQRQFGELSPHRQGYYLVYVASLNQQEDRLAKINSEISAKEVELTGRQREYLTTVKLITFDQTR